MSIHNYTYVSFSFLAAFLSWLQLIALNHFYNDLLAENKSHICLVHILLESKTDLLVPSQAVGEIQGLMNRKDKLMSQKKLLMRKQDILIRKVSALSGEMTLGTECMHNKINTEVKNEIPGHGDPGVVLTSFECGWKGWVHMEGAHFQISK